MHTEFTLNLRHGNRDAFLVGDRVSFLKNMPSSADIVSIESAPAGSALIDAPIADGADVTLDVEGVYVVTVGRKGTPGFFRATIRAFDPAICSWPRLRTRGTSVARAVFRGMYLELGETVTWHAGTSVNPLPLRLDGAYVDPMLYGAPTASDSEHSSDGNVLHPAPPRTSRSVVHGRATPPKEVA